MTINDRLLVGTTAPDLVDVGGTISSGRSSTPDPNLTTTKSGSESLTSSTIVKEKLDH
jgi:hypothetical protein